MTPTRYFIARFAQAFGYFRRNQRMGDAASEMHLLREAEAYLGSEIWEKVEGIEALSVEYWNLRKLIKEREQARAKFVACQEKLNLAHEERVSLLSNLPGTNQELIDERIAILANLQELGKKRDKIIVDAREVRRTYVGFKTKLEVLTNESNDSSEHREQIEKVKDRLRALHEEFVALKQQRIHIGKMIEENDAKIDIVDGKLSEKQQDHRVNASAAFQAIGEGNKEMSLLRAENALIDTQTRQLFAEIGRHVSRNAQRDPACAAAAASYHGLIDVMHALRRSIALNHRLAGTA